MLRDKMLAVMTDLRRDVVEREELIEAIAIALLTRKNLFILGDPGQAKSFVINGFRSRITGARQFERLLTKQADEEQLFGRTDLSSLIPGHVPQSVLEQDATYRRLRGELEAVVALMPTQPDDPEAYEQMAAATERLEAYKKAVASLYRSEPMVLTTGKIPEADICFLDEAFKCNDGVLNSLLTALNERKYTNEGRTYWDARYNNAAFKADLTRVVDWLRVGFAPLKNLENMGAFCARYAHAAIPGQDRTYGFRIETKRYRYMLRCTPVEKVYHVYLYCYGKEAVAH